uniref:Uncharacterized protein n=1 Tax=Dermatophagoides pteronyssinus TaxID=6956 RepID=A0A6P6XMS0_DERPT|nr:putative uncharacterized protein DDB_G0294196 [Dermatophagoides pteronyssinus]
MMMRKNLHQLSPVMIILSLSFLCLIISTCLGQEQTTITNEPSNVTESSSLPSEATTPISIQDDVSTVGTDNTSEQSVNADSNDGTDRANNQSDDESSDNQQQPKVFIIHHHYNGPPPYSDFMNRLQPVPSPSDQQSSSPSIPNQNNFNNLPPEFQDPNYPFGSQIQSRSQNFPQQPQSEESQPNANDEDLGRFDPLGQFSDQQKKRQFFQDLLHNQLSKFESEIEPMIEKEDNMTEKNDMEDLLASVRDLKRSVENHQIFNITELMDDWKEGRIQPPSMQSSNQKPKNQQQQQQSSSPMPHFMHNYHPKQFRQQWPSSSSSYSSAIDIPQIPASHSEMTLNIRPPKTRTLLLVPQSRLIQPEFAPQFHPGGNGFQSGFYPPHLQAPRGFYSVQQQQHPQSTDMQPMMFQRRSSMIPQFNRYPMKSGVQYTLGRSADSDAENAHPINVSPTTDKANDNDSNDNQRSSSLENASASPSSNAYGPEIEYQK